MGKKVFNERWLGVTPIRYKTVKLTSAEILALFTTAKTLVPAQGAGKIVEFVSAVFFLDYGSIDYATRGILTVKTTGDTALSAPIAAASLVQLSADGYRVASALSADDIALVSNEGLKLTCNTGNPTAGDSEIIVHVAYRVHDFN